MCTPERNEKRTFLAEWFQKEAGITRPFHLGYFPFDNTIDLFDQRAGKLFMRRTAVPRLDATHLFVGAKVNIYGRQFDIVDYADAATRCALASARERTVCLLKPPALLRLDRLLPRICAGFALNNCQMVRFTSAQARRFLEASRGGGADDNGAGGDSLLTAELTHLESGCVLALELIAPDAVAKLRAVCGPDDPEVARAQAPDSLRAQYGIDACNNYVHCAASAAEADRLVAWLFPGARMAAAAASKRPVDCSGGRGAVGADVNEFASTALMHNTTCGVVKPHAVLAGQLPGIVAAIYAAGMRVTAVRMLRLERASCEEFYEVYRGVVPEYEANVLELQQGPCVAIEVQCVEASGCAHAEFRRLCGPANVEIAKQLRPDTIRARFGVAKVQNAIHCTDLEEDTRSEIAYLFKILQ